MSDQDDNKENADSERVNAELKRGLRQCHTLIDDYRSTLIAANSNEPPFLLTENKDETDD